jgi:hypothetical protein
MLSIAYPNAIPYSREGIYKVLTETFGEMTLGDAFKKQNRKLIGGVAMGFPRSNTVIHDELEIFDTQNPKVRKFLNFQEPTWAYGLSKDSPGPYARFRGGTPAGQAACGCLLPF